MGSYSHPWVNEKVRTHLGPNASVFKGILHQRGCVRDSGAGGICRHGACVHRHD